MKFLLISGSVAKKAHTLALLTYLDKLLIKEGFGSKIWDLRTNPLPIAPPEFHDNPLECLEPNVQKFVKAVTEADGLILGTPLYHGSFSGVLKNALDNLSGDGFKNKPVGIVSNASTVRNIAACDALRPVIRAMGGYATQSQIATQKIDYKENGEEYLLVAEDIKLRCSRLITEILSLAQVLKNHKF